MTVNCEQITIPFCQNMPYTMGQFPNLLNHQTQDEAKTSKFRLLIESRCSPDIAPLVCSVLAPPCNGTRKPVVPCKELCKRATKNCKAQLKKFGIRLDSSMRCRFLPKESTSKCFNGSWPKNTPGESPIKAPRRQNIPQRTIEKIRSHRRNVSATLKVIINRKLLYSLTWDQPWLLYNICVQFV